MVFPSSLQVHDETGIICQGAESLALVGPFTSWELVEPSEGIYQITETDDDFYWVALAAFVQCPEWEIKKTSWYHIRKSHAKSLADFSQKCRSEYLARYNQINILAKVRSQGGSLAEQAFRVDRAALRGTNPTESVRQAFAEWLQGQPYSQGWTLLSWEIISEEAADAWWFSKPNLAPVTA